jgi:hypothetical protein
MRDAEAWFYCQQKPALASIPECVQLNSKEVNWIIAQNQTAVLGGNSST